LRPWGRGWSQLRRERECRLFAALVDHDDAAIVAAPEVLVGVQELDAVDRAVRRYAIFSSSLTQMVSTWPDFSRRRM
jgi:hypothetical protein